MNAALALSLLRESILLLGPKSTTGRWVLVFTYDSGHCICVRRVAR
jgi:hypothetical protein